MLETYVKWCCDLEHITYKKESNLQLLNRNHDYTTKKYSDLKIEANVIKEQMTMYDYILEEVAM